MSKIKELFGIYCSKDADVTNALSSQICPYSNKKCYKTRKSDPNTAIGTCTVSYQEKNIIICPNRLTENRQIFIDCIHLLTLHEPGNELYVLPEISLPGGNVDYFLVSVKNGKVKDFIGIELQTMDTTGTVWPERQKLLNEYGFTVDEKDIKSTKLFGMNWKMTAKTILIQLHHKTKTFENLNKHLVLIIQKPFFDYINREFSFSHISGVRLGDSVHIHSYDFLNIGDKLKLSLDSRVSTDSEGISQCLGLNAEANVALEDIISTLEKKLSSEYLLRLQ
jgi:hypothetical protein